MKNTIIFINLGNFGSTGTIIREIGQCAEKKGFSCFYAYPDTKRNRKIEDHDIIICSDLRRKIAEKLSIYTGLRDIWLIWETRKFLKKIDLIKPDIIHLNNLHDTYLNLYMLFKYIKKNNIQVVWTLHDCWAFTGHCPHYSMVKCDRWKFGCGKCKQLKYYPYAKVDRTKIMWILKRRWFTGVPKIQLITPSKWLAEQVSESYLNNYPIKIINNGIDLSIFKPTESLFRYTHNLVDKHIILGVSTDWSNKKGLDIFIELSSKLDSNYVIVLIGTDENIEKILPSNIISIRRTHNQKELAEIYSIADVFVNATKEEVFGLVNVESLACGTPVITFNSGGSPECISTKCGYVLHENNITELINKIKYVCENKPFSKANCIKHAKKFNKNIKYNEYIDLYFNLLGKD